MPTRATRGAALLALLVTITACSGGGSATGAPAGEDRQLDEAAAALDANSPDSNAAEIVDEDESGNEDQPQ